MNTPQPRIRRSIIELQIAYESGNKKPLEDLMRAWKGIKELPANDPRSFFMLGGFHGEPFRGPGSTDPAYWGGYCNHGNVLFPTWHRVYLFKLEEALRSIEGCEHVTLPYWDETDAYSLEKGIPSALTDEFFTLDGEQIPNPLRSFVLPKALADNVQGDNSTYAKPVGYETVRYPLSGLVGTPEDLAQTQAHNAKFPSYKENTAILNTNVVDWLTHEYVVIADPDGTTKYRPANVHQQYIDCLNAPNYTVFSNNTSAKQWNNDHLQTGQRPYVSLEAPHNCIHLSVGGFYILGQGSASSIPGANGDMGENNTAGLDPIFYFHHCNVDRVFWLWQKKWNATNALETIDFYPGTNSSDAQGPVPGVPANELLDLNTPLYPFKKENGAYYVSNECINIETQMGFTYSQGSLEEYQTASPKMLATSEETPIRTIKVFGINRAPIRGSFTISAFATIDGKKQLIGTEAILSRWDVQFCANCQTHLEAGAFFALPVQGMLKQGENALEAQVSKDDIDIVITGREGDMQEGTTNNLLRATTSTVPFQFEII